MKLKGLFEQELNVVNMGLESFYHDLKAQTQTLQMDWRPRAGGNKKTIQLLDRLRKK